MQTYKIMVFAQAAAELLDETATRLQEGKIDGFQAFGYLLGAGVVTKAVAESEIEPVPALTDVFGDTLVLNAQVRDVVSRWFNKDITSKQVLEELPPIQSEFEQVLAEAEQALQGEYGLDAEEMGDVRRTAMDDFAKLFEPTPTPTVIP
ncbi:MAG: hypothetical protein IT317_24770 [Anaerolineales bacterium]|nr:hypothetical protein [Anaerolineales bacterium]